MSDLFVSQIMSLEAPQQELDRVAKGQVQTAQAQQTNNQVFLKALDESLFVVNQLLETEQGDSILEQDEESEEDEQEKEER